MTAAQDHPYGFSPHSSASQEFDDPLAYDEDELPYGEDDDSFGAADDGPAQTTKPKKSNNRKGPHNVDKRNLHNATERARRDNLNNSFTDLSQALPTMRHIKRPSKAVIVAKALDFVYDSQVREHALVKENNELRREVDALRARLGMSALPPPAPLPEPKMATHSTLRKSKKEAAARARAATAAVLEAATSASAVEQKPVLPEMSTVEEAAVYVPLPAQVGDVSPITPQLPSPTAYGALAHASPSNASQSSSIFEQAAFSASPAHQPQQVFLQQQQHQPPVYPPLYCSTTSPASSVGSTAPVEHQPLSSSPTTLEAPLFAPSLSANPFFTSAPSLATLPLPAPHHVPMQAPSQQQQQQQNAYQAMLQQQAAAAFMHSQAQIAGMLAASSSAAPPPPSVAAYNPSAAYLNPQILFAFQQQQQQRQAQQQQQQQVPYMAAGLSGGDWMASSGMFASTPTVDGLGF